MILPPAARAPRARSALGPMPKAGWLALTLATGRLAAAPAPAAAQRDPGAMEAVVLGVEYAETPDISPDGVWIAYAHRFADPAEDRWLSEIVRTRTDGGGSETLTAGPADRTPRFSPDGGRLAYVSLTDGFWQIRVLSLATRRRRELAIGSRPIGTIAWSPDGGRIAYLREDGDREESGVDARVRVWIVDVASGADREPSATSFPGTALPLDAPLSWTPDGAALVFAADPDATAADGGAGSEILELPAAGGAIRRVTSRPGPDEDPVVSPDGRTLAFIAGEPGSASSRRLTLLERLGGGGQRPLLDRSSLRPRRPAWPPDGRSVLVLVEEAGRERLLRVDLDGTARPLAEGLGTGSTATAGTAAYAVSADSADPRFVATAIDPGGAGELVVGSLRPGELARTLTWINRDLRLDTLVSVERIELPDTIAPANPIDRGTGEPGVRPEVPAAPAIPDASPGGASAASTWVLRPRSATGPLPGILVVHGGCGPTYGAAFDPGLAALAATGFALLVTDPRGDPGSVLSAATALGGLDGVDGERLFLLEEHGDGRLAARALADGAPFRAAVAHRTAGCGHGPDAPTPGLTVLDAPVGRFDEPPRALTARLQATIDAFDAAPPLGGPGG